MNSKTSLTALQIATIIWNDLQEETGTWISAPPGRIPLLESPPYARVEMEPELEEGIRAVAGKVGRS
jgi:hypothetical protein